MAIRAHWKVASGLVAENRGVLDARPGEGDAPDALVSRGWAGFLLSLTDAQLAAIEVEGHEATWPGDTPPSLLALVKKARDVCGIPAFTAPSGPLGPARKRETPRKRAQVDAFARLILPLSAHATRVVDVGSGHGHLTRAIAERIALPVVGLERDVTLAGRARMLSSGADASPTFAVTDVLRDGLALAAGDCVIGLHACGELGDAMVSTVARCGASLALVGCCLQKRRTTSRTPLCSAPGLDDALDLPRGLLGLSNLTAREEGVEATRVENLAARVRRLALHRLLAGAGCSLRLGAEIEGLNRRAAQGDLDVLVARAFALRELSPPTPRAFEEAAAWASTQHARTRRLSLPRAMLARALEVFVLLDRAVYLEEHGFAVSIGTLFPETVSARNLALIANRLG